MPDTNQHSVRERNALRLLASEETWAAAHPNGTFGLPPNTWGPAPSWVRTLARTALESNPASVPPDDTKTQSLHHAGGSFQDRSAIPEANITLALKLQERIAELEAALREIADAPDVGLVLGIARRALGGGEE